MEMHEIRYFLNVCKTLNFTRAAELSNVTQPALTRAIQKLEAELRAPLFSRERNHIQLTDFGRLMRPHLEEVLRQTQTATQVAKGFLNLEAAPLKLGVMCTIGPLRFIALLNSFRTQHPGIELTVVETMPARLSQLLLEGALDIALMAQPEAFDERLHAEPIYRERFGVAFAAGHRFEMRNMLHVRDVQGETYLSRVNCEFYDYLSNLCDRHGVEMVDGFRSEREDWILAMVAAGMGICFLPEYSATHPGVRLRTMADPEVVREVSLVSVKARPISPAVKCFVDAVRDHDWGEPVQNGAEPLHAENR
jgi:LysR family transcriptional regulator, hydrogen peroxide-inducible genes activator